ncbi:endonuclease V isoform X6 [Notamacropus eugenii]|uniref:endonuclease V isoform X6 n=1 Tax=Notamacropus eugenii TaxID=9315 RepID=UPI003B6860D3
MAHEALGPPPRETLSRWEREQARLKASVIDWDTEVWQRDSDFAGLHRIGGVDISFIKGDDVRACASLVVLSYPELEVLYEECRMVNLTAPYVSGFLAFREVPFLVDAIQRLQKKESSLMPQVLLVDGNGVLHHRGFGVACHIGILTDLPCIGVAKKLLQVDGLKNNDLHKEKIQQLKTGGDTFPLLADSGLEEPPQEQQASVCLCGSQDESGGRSPPDPNLLQIPDPRAHSPGRHSIPRIYPEDYSACQLTRSGKGEDWLSISVSTGEDM